MKNQSFNITFLVNKTPAEVFNAIINVRGWWSQEIEGKTDALGDEFSYRHGAVHFSNHKIVEIVEDERIVWLTTDSKLNFVKVQNEWNGTKMIFEISKQADNTKLDITHEGLVPSFECYGSCTMGWTHYLKNSLLPLIIEGEGKPDKEKS